LSKTLEKCLNSLSIFWGEVHFQTRELFFDLEERNCGLKKGGESIIKSDHVVHKVIDDKQRRQSKRIHWGKYFGFLYLQD